MSKIDDRSAALCRIREESEALLIGKFLDQAGIPHMFDSYHSIPYNSLFQFGQGYAGEIRVVEADLHKARDVLDEYHAWLETGDPHEEPPQQPSGGDSQE
jgi:hypothetical protein